MTNESDNVIHLRFAREMRTFTFDPSVPLNLTDDDRYRMFVTDVHRFLLEEPRKLSLFVWCNADLVEEVSDDFAHKAVMMTTVGLAVHIIVLNTLVGLAQNKDAESPGLKALCKAVREGQWFAAATATRAWQSELKRHGVEDDDLAFLPPLRNVLLGLLDQPLSEQCGHLRACIEYAKSFGSDKLFNHVANALLRAARKEGTTA